MSARTRRDLLAAATFALALAACPSFERIECRTDADCPGAGAVCDVASGSCGAGEPGGTGRWPDSPTVFCSDGEAEVDPCPPPGTRGHGQDGNYRLQVPSYDRTGETTLDSVTGLVWEEQSTEGGLSWEAASLRCRNLALAGRTWRLPSRLELASLLDLGSNGSFPGVYTGGHWASSRGSDPGEAWTVSFLNGSVATEAVEAELFVLCVSGEPLAGGREELGDVLLDRRTGLSWQRTPAEQALPWLDALAHCEGLELAGSTDWRLASGKELLTIVEDSQLPAAGLDGASDGDYWTSSAEWPGVRARTVRFPDGRTGADTTVFELHFRCVRGP